MLACLAFLSTLVTFRSSLRISPAEVKARLHPPTPQASSERSDAQQREPVEDQEIEDALEEFRGFFPPPAYDWLTAKRILRTAISQIDSRNERVNFLRELREVLAEFPADERRDAFNTFVQMRDEREKEWAESLPQRLAAQVLSLTGIAWTLGTIAVVSIVLVLLGIERNTRQHPST
jgi:hypothetical protein